MKARYAFPILFAALGLYAGTPPGARWWGYVRELASDKSQGRATASPGYRQAAEMVSGEFKKLGLVPGGKSGYMQPVPLTVRKMREQESSVALVRGGIQELLEMGTDAYINLNIESSPQVDAPAAFVGYGLTVPEAGYDDLAGVDLKGRVAVFLRGGPASIPGPLRAHYQSLRERQVFLRKAGAVGIVTILDPSSMDMPWERYSANRLEPFMSLSGPGMQDGGDLALSITINPTRAEKWFAGTEHTFAELLDRAKAGRPLPGFPLAWSVRAAVSADRSEAECVNVAAVLRGTDRRLRDEYVVISAHLDHLGVGAPVNGDSIYNGALDNAGGAASLIEVARALKTAPPRRSVLFLALTGEEKGLLGSRYFASHPSVPAASIVADLNLDMFLPIHRLRVLTVLGLGESSLGNDIRAVAKALGVGVQADNEPDRNRFIRADQYNFILAGVPSLALKFGFTPGSPEERLQKQWLAQRYHAPSDDAMQPVNLAAAARFNRIVADLARRVANRTARPAWNRSSFFRRFAGGSN